MNHPVSPEFFQATHVEPETMRRLARMRIAETR
jgi:hypothetical protein